ncbi:MAG TPA: DUF6089 family protein [Chitinophagaceae bacterium]|nr:DUF6089 family protein [Chitinophagaceae bacterium]
MKQKIISKALLVIAVFCIGTKIKAQQYEFGINLGSVIYQGDLTPEQFGSFKTQQFAAGLHADRVLSPSFSVRANLLISNLKGDDSKFNDPEYRKQRNFYFTSPLVEVSALLLFNVMGKNNADKGFSPYVFAGAGLSFLHIKRDWSRINRSYFNSETDPMWAGLAEDSVHALPNIIPVVPVGAGVRYFFSPQWGINAEASYRLSYTDYIDGFSKSANPDLNDHYLNYAIGLIFRPGKKSSQGCPVIQY